ncbi:MAG: hypothetical protein IBJ10_00500 [Phycisphaerales bacterium]|nr:hypothetical protein [Phycisphaerales bacterium]
MNTGEPRPTEDARRSFGANTKNPLPNLRPEDSDVRREYDGVCGTRCFRVTRGDLPHAPGEGAFHEVELGHIAEPMT